MLYQRLDGTGSACPPSHSHPDGRKSWPAKRRSAAHSGSRRWAGSSLPVRAPQNLTGGTDDFVRSHHRFERDEARTANRGGFSFLFVHGLTSLVAAVLTFVLPVGTAALIFMFQGLVAFPPSLLLERALGYRMVSRENTLQPLFIQVASIQLLALPAVIVAYSLNPLYTPVAFAAVGGAHFLPYTGCSNPGLQLAWRSSWPSGRTSCQAGDRVGVPCDGLHPGHRAAHRLGSRVDDRSTTVGARRSGRRA